MLAELLNEKRDCPVEQNTEINIRKQIIIRDRKNEIETLAHLSNEKKRKLINLS